MCVLFFVFTEMLEVGWQHLSWRRHLCACRFTRAERPKRGLIRCVRGSSEE